MVDFIGIIVLVVYLFAAASSKKKKAQKKQKKPRSRREADFARAYDKQFEKQVQAAAERPYAAQKAEHAASRADCGKERLHLHAATQQQMRMADEGEDPCHKGGAPMQEDSPNQPLFSYDEQEAEQNAFAQDVLRGVIMSEILTRPCERAALRRNEWSKG